MRRVVVLRPEPGASATVELARQGGLDPFALPLFEVEPVAWEMPDTGRFDALLLTSANAVRHGGAGLTKLRHLPVHAIGAATADAARSAGFAVASTGEAGVDALLEMLEPELSLLHLCGEDRREPANPRQLIRPLAVYRSDESPAPDMRTAQGCVALIHSPRAGARFAELVQDRSTIAVAAISRAAADAVGSGWQSVDCADAPNDDALLALAERLCNKRGT